MRVTFPIAVALALTVASQPAVAQSDNGATISKDGLCGGAVPTADGGFSELISTNDSQVVTSKSGNTTLTCHFTIPAQLLPARSTHAEGFACGTFVGLTMDSRMSASPGGSATLVCKINKKTI